MHGALLPSKIHSAFAICCERHYEGSWAMDEDLLDAANRPVALRDHVPTQAL